jgi:hypothetical protein
MAGWRLIGAEWSLQASNNIKKAINTTKKDRHVA